MATALSTMLSRARNRINEASTTFVSDECLIRWCNRGEFDIAVKSLCIEDISAVSSKINTRRIRTSGIHTHYVEYVPDSGKPKGLLKITPGMINNQHMRATLRTPAYWFPWGNSIFIEPIPAAELNFNVYQSIVPAYQMEDDDDTSQLPEGFVKFIYDYIEICAQYRDANYATAGLLYQNYLANMQSARNDILAKYFNRVNDLVLPDRISVE